MKKITAVVLCLVIVLSSLCLRTFAKNEPTVADLDMGDVSFSADYAEIGKELKVFVAGTEDETLLYKWYIDNVQINNFSDSYTPVEGDLEKMLTVKIYNTDCELIGEKSIFVSELPVVYIEVDNRNSIVYKDVQLDAQMKIQGNGEFNNPDKLYDGKIQIKGRGNSTWSADKKPYKLKLDSKADLFGMGKSKHWVLLSNPYDSSNLRNVVSFGLSGDMGLNYQKSVLVDLVLNGKSVGVYQLCEHIRIEENRVDITNWDDIAEDAAKAIYKKNTDIMTKDERDELVDQMTANMDWTTTDTVTYKGHTFKISDYYEIPPITGGYLLEVLVKNEQNSFTALSSGEKLNVDKPEGIGKDMFSYIKDYYSAFDNALMSDDYCTVYNGKKMRYTDFIDAESFAKGILINEIFENSDFGHKSVWISKDIDGKLVYGPVWDMDYTTISSFKNWTSARRPWMKKMLCDPVMMELVRNIYFEYRYTAIQDLIDKDGDIESAAAKICSAAEHNDEIWENPVSFKDNADDLRLRLQTKINWLDKQFNTLESAITSVAPDSQYADFIRSSDMTLSLNGDELNIGIKTAFKTAEVYINGNLYTKFGESTEKKVILPAVDSDYVVTVIAYDESGKPVCGNYISSQRYVRFLTVTKNPDKMTYNTGEKIDLTGLVLTAEYNNKTEQTVAPDMAYTYARDSFGMQMFCRDEITKKEGNVYLVLMYQNAKVELKLNVNPSEDYSAAEYAISNIMSEKSIEYYKTLLNAKIKYDALSEEAKKNVSNASELTAAWEAFTAATSADDVGTICGCGDGVVRFDTKSNIMVCVKGSPRAIVFEYSSGGTSTYIRSHINVMYIKSVADGQYEVWTINQALNASVLSYAIRASYNGNPDKKSINVFASDLVYSEKAVSNLTYDKYVFENEDCQFAFIRSGFVSKVKFTENGTEIKDFGTGQNFVFRFDTAGKHTLKLNYLSDGKWYEYGMFDVFVREKPETGKVFFKEYADSAYTSQTQMKVIADSGANKVYLTSENGNVNLTSENKNGYKIFTGMFDVGKSYKLYADGVLLDENVAADRLGDVNLDGTINSYDALLVLQFVTEEKIPSKGEKYRAELNGDGKLSSYDALLILNIATGKIV